MFLSRQKFCRKILGSWRQNVFVATKVLSQQTRPLSRQKYVYRDKSCVVTNIKLFQVYKHNFVATKLLLRQAYFCALSGQTHVCCDKHVFVATNVMAVPADDRDHDNC